MIECATLMQLHKINIKRLWITNSTGIQLDYALVNLCHAD